MKICFVCSANICRSFLAQELLKKFLKEKEIADIEVCSRGTFVFPNLQIPQKIKNFLKSNNIEYIGHNPTLISKQDFETSDIILVMTNNQYEEITDKYSQYYDKIYLLSDYCYGKRKDIEDPIDKEGLLFSKIATNLKQTIKDLSEKLTINR